MRARMFFLGAIPLALSAPLSLATAQSEDAGSDPRALLGIEVSMSGTSRDTLGVLVSSVVSGSPADRAGIQERDRIAEVLHLIRLTAQARQQAGALSHGQKQWLEIGMLLMQNPRILLVDEPVAGMTGEETERTAELLTSLAGRHAVIVVEHDMAFVRSIARTVTVLHQGSVLAEGSMDKIQNDPKVIEVYLGE